MMQSNRVDIKSILWRGFALPGHEVCRLFFQNSRNGIWRELQYSLMRDNLFSLIIKSSVMQPGKLFQPMWKAGSVRRLSEFRLNRSHTTLVA